MELIRIIKFLMPLVLIIGTSPVSAQYDLGRCVDILTSSISNMAICDAMKIYMKCVVKEMNLHNLNLSPEILQTVQDQMDAQLSESGGINCDLDLQAIVTEVRNEEASGTDGTTRKPPTFETATTLGDCITALTNAGIGAGGITCSLASGYTKCAIRVMGFLDTNPGTEEIQLFKETMDAQLQEQGLSCDLDIQAMIDEIKAEVSGGTVTTKPGATTTDSAVTWDFSSQAFTDCLQGFQDSGNDYCAAANKVLKCFIRSMGSNFDKLSTSQKSQFESQFETLLRMYTNVDCSINIDALAAEVRNERNGANSQLRPLHGVSMALVTLFTVLFSKLLW